MVYKNKDRKFGELEEYVGVYPEKDIRKLMECKGLLFTKYELELAKQRWVRKGQPDLKEKFMDIFK
tara:strand:- start:221 stop:418 length:198 start_codon:yes stop_codon:yes gene_type:complete